MLHFKFKFCNYTSLFYYVMLCYEHVYSQEAEYIKILKVTIKYNNNNNSKIRYMLKQNRHNKKNLEATILCYVMSVQLLPNLVEKVEC